MFLKSLLAQHVSDVTASIVRSTTVCTAIGFFGFWCVYSMRLVMVLGHIVTISRSVSDSESETDRDIVTRNQKKPMAVHTVVLLTMDAVTSETC
jgi:hypothetical protein